MFTWVKRHKISSVLMILVAGIIIGLGIAARFNLPPKSNAAPPPAVPEEKIVNTVNVTGEVDIENA